MEKVEISKERLGMIASGKCIFSCGECPLCDSHGPESCRASIARVLLTERAEREKNPGVWDGAPEWADVLMCERNFMHSQGCGTASRVITSRYTRTLPKTKAREIAERHLVAFENILACEAAINEAMEGEK